MVNGFQPHSNARIFKKHNLSLRHCNGNPIYIFPEKEFRGLSSNFHIHVSVSDLYNPRIGPHIFLLQNRQTGREIFNNTCNGPLIGDIIVRKLREQ
jgi:hypothetical protein